MRVLILDSYYRAFWQAHYRERPGLAERSYAEQHESLMSRSFGTSDAYSHHLREAGHEAREVVVNCVPLQAAWARERGTAGLARRLAQLPALSRATNRTLLPSVLVAQIEEFDPDVVYVQDIAGLWSSVRARVAGGRRMLAAQIASAAPRDTVLRDCDLVITSFPHWVARLRAQGIDSEYLPLAFDERVLGSVGADGERPHPVTFVGTLAATDYGGGAQRALEHACAQLDVSVWGGGAELDSGSAILRDYRGEAWGLDMYRVLAGSKLTLNRHGDIAEGHANNMRLFEATGMGAVVLTEAAPNLGELFEPGLEVIAYEGPDDLVDKARSLLDDDAERRAIARAGQRRTLADHTYRARVPRILELLAERRG